MEINEILSGIVERGRTATNYAALIGGVIFTGYATLYLYHMESFRAVLPFEAVVLCIALAFTGMVLFIISVLGFMKADLIAKLNEIEEAIKHG